MLPRAPCSREGWPQPRPVSWTAPVLPLALAPAVPQRSQCVEPQRSLRAVPQRSLRAVPQRSLRAVRRGRIGRLIPRPLQRISSFPASVRRSDRQGVANEKAIREGASDLLRPRVARRRPEDRGEALTRERAGRVLSCEGTNTAADAAATLGYQPVYTRSSSADVHDRAGDRPVRARLTRSTFWVSHTPSGRPGRQVSWSCEERRVCACCPLTSVIRVHG